MWLLGRHQVLISLARRRKTATVPLYGRGYGVCSSLQGSQVRAVESGITHWSPAGFPSFLPLETPQANVETMPTPFSLSLPSLWLLGTERFAVSVWDWPPWRSYFIKSHRMLPLLQLQILT